jgi:DNA topoisomerase-3
MDEKVKSPEMTGEWEYKLSQVEKGTLTPVEFRDGIVNYVKELFEHLREKYGSQFERETVTEAIACPKCGQPLEIAPWGYVCKNAECGFKTGHTIAGRMLSHSEMKQLLETRATPVLDGFISKKGTNFSAILKLDEEFKTVFEFPKRAFPKRDLPCPCCGDQLRFRKGTGEKGENLSAFVCPQCGYGIPQVFYQRKFTDEEVEGLLKNKFTPVLEPFKKNETTFRAALEIKENGKLAFNKLTVEVISQKN